MNDEIENDGIDLADWADQGCHWRGELKKRVQARNMAIQQIDLMIERVGSVKFNAVIQKVSKA